MTVYEAIREMRRRSEQHRPFAFSYMSYSLQRGESHEEMEVEHAILYKNPKADDEDVSNFMLTYRDQRSPLTSRLRLPGTASPTRR